MHLLQDTFGLHTVGSKYPGHRPLQVDSFYSDVLYGPWMRATIEIDPSWLEVENIDRRSNLSVEVSSPPVVLSAHAGHVPAQPAQPVNWLRACAQPE